MTVNNKLAGFMAIGMFPHPIKPYRKVHRLVILPDYQGLGLGKIFLNYMGSVICDYDFSITTSQPSLVYSLKKDKNWICISHGLGKKMGGRGGRFQTDVGKNFNKTISLNRIISTFVYKGEKDVKYKKS